MAKFFGQLSALIALNEFLLTLNIRFDYPINSLKTFFFGCSSATIRRLIWWIFK